MTPFKDYIKENVEKHIAAPTTVLLRRVAIRQFPGQESVVLYTNEALGLKVTVPIDNFTGKMKPTNVYGMSESLEERYSEAPHHLYGEWEDEVKQKGAVSIKHHPSPEEFEGHKGHSIAYGSDGSIKGTFNHTYNHGFCTEETATPGNLTEAPIHSINTILRTGEEREVAFRNGASARVHPVTAKAIHDLWHKVNSTNKAKLSELINSSPEGLVKVAKFASDLAGAKK